MQELEYKEPEISSVIEENPEDYFRNELTEKQRMVLDYLFHLDNKYQGVVYPSQDLIAKVVNVSREYVNTILKRFESLGILKKVYFHRRPSSYIISNFFKNPVIRSRLRHIFKSFIVFIPMSLALLTPLNIVRAIGINNINIKQTRNSMSFISPAVKNIKNLNLTLQQQVQLSHFPDEAIEYADKVLGYCTRVKDPLAWFISVCKDYCQREGIAINPLANRIERERASEASPQRVQGVFTGEGEGEKRVHNPRSADNGHYSNTRNMQYDDPRIKQKIAFERVSSYKKWEKVERVVDDRPLEEKEKRLREYLEKEKDNPFIKFIGEDLMIGLARKSLEITRELYLNKKESRNGSYR